MMIFNINVLYKFAVSFAGGKEKKSDKIASLVASNLHIFCIFAPISYKAWGVEEAMKFNFHAHKNKLFFKDWKLYVYDMNFKD